jgi:hypothetical protein
MTDKYAHKDWVAPRRHKDEHGNEIGRPYYVDVPEGTESARHRAKKNFNAVDRNDRESADYSTTICKSHYYIQIFCWALNRVIHAVYVIVCNLSKAGMGPTWWKAYESFFFAIMVFRLISQLI